MTSQFEQHLRAVLDLPLGDTSVLEGVAVMKNYLGGENEDIFGVYPLALSAEPRAKIHFYGKETRPGRKIGHVNISGTVAELRRCAIAPRMPPPFCVTAAPVALFLAGAWGGRILCIRRP